MINSEAIYSLRVAQQGPVNPVGHWQLYEQVFGFAIHPPPFKQGLELQGLLSL